MNKVKFLTIISISLLLVNLVLLGFMFFKKNRNEGPRNIIIEKLAFDESQIKEYDKLIEGHRTHIRQAEQETRILKNQLYASLTNNNAAKDSLIGELVKTFINIENIHYAHFEDIKTICKEDQQQKFALLTQEIAQLFSKSTSKPETK